MRGQSTLSPHHDGPLHSLIVFRLSEVLVTQKALQQLVLPTLQILGRSTRGTVRSRTRYHRRQNCRLLGKQLRWGFAKVVLGRRPDSVHPVAPFDDVQVDLEDALLGEMLLHISSNEEFANL